MDTIKITCQKAQNQRDRRSFQLWQGKSILHMCFMHRNLDCFGCYYALLLGLDNLSERCLFKYLAQRLYYKTKNCVYSVIVEAVKVDSLQRLCSSLEPLFRRIVS